MVYWVVMLQDDQLVTNTEDITGHVKRIFQKHQLIGRLFHRRSTRKMHVQGAKCSPRSLYGWHFALLLSVGSTRILWSSRRTEALEIQRSRKNPAVRALVTLCLSSRRRAATFLFILLSDVARGVTLRCCGSECSPILYSMHKSVSFSNAENDIAICALTG